MHIQKFLLMTLCFYSKLQKLHGISVQPCVYFVNYRAGLYLMRRAHEDVVGHFSEGYTQVDDVILSAAALRQVTDVDDTTRTRFTLKKL